MKTKDFVFGGVLMLAAGVAGAVSTPAGWSDDLDAALERAKANGRYVLVDFSGSDWCGWCKRLDREVFSQAAFMGEATNKYELVFIDSPQDEGLLTARAREENPKLVDKYAVRGFPTILVLNAAGEAVAKTGYKKGGPENYLRLLDAAVVNAPYVEEWIVPLEKGSDAILAELDRAMTAVMKEIQAKGGKATRKKVMKAGKAHLKDAAEALGALVEAEEAKSAAAAGKVPESVLAEREETLKGLKDVLKAIKDDLAKATK